jgi:hypothetical protein
MQSVQGGALQGMQKEGHFMLVGGNERAWGAAANLDVNKRLIHKLGHLLIFKRLHLHHMAPSTSTHITT